jgi:hypothetical protein
VGQLSAINRIAAFFKPALAAAFVGIAVWAFQGWHLLIIIVIAAGICLTGIVLLGVVDTKEVHFLRDLLSRREASVLEEGGL